MDLLKDISNTFWSTRVWLPPNTKWEDIAPGSRPDVNHADYRHLIYPIPMAAVVLVIRFVVEK
jgi:sphingoid base N-palmitoyltransferase